MERKTFEREFKEESKRNLMTDLDIEERKYSQWKVYYPRNSRRVKNINKAGYMYSP